MTIQELRKLAQAVVDKNRQSNQCRNIVNEKMFDYKPIIEQLSAPMSASLEILASMASLRKPKKMAGKQ